MLVDAEHMGWQVYGSDQFEGMKAGCSFTAAHPQYPVYTNGCADS
jgi:hypothetical protein